MLLTVVSVEGWSLPSDFSLPVSARPYHSSALVVVALVEIYHRCHVVDSSECVRVVYPKRLFQPSQRSAVPFECFAVVALVVIRRCHVVDSSECGGVVFPKRLFRPN
jgi:hypothetical protein